MKRIEIKNLNGVVTNRCEAEDADAQLWLDSCLAKNKFGPSGSFTVEVTDITELVARRETNAEALAFLASTDWYVIREMDEGTPCPEEVKLARAEARQRIIR